MTSERDIVRTDPADFEQGWKEMTQGFWVKKTPDGLEVRTQCAVCKTITAQPNIQDLTEGEIHVFKCLCGTEKKVEVPTARKTIQVAEVKPNPNGQDGIMSVIGGGK